jgi:hypothetical protein
MTSPQAKPAPLPPNGVLLHIGPHKTGTSALQSALATSREALQHQGVLAADPLAQYRGATSLTGWTRGAMEKGEVPPATDWETLDTWVRTHDDDRLIISSEWFDDCTTEMIQTLRDSWGAQRLRVMVTCRSLERVMPSTWQQAVKTGALYSYEDWLRPLLKGPESARGKRGHRFWYRHDDAALVQRWADVVGVDNVVVVIADEREPDLLYRRTEELLAVPRGTITPGPISNRSLTLPEIVAVQAVYRAVGATETEAQRHKWLQRGAVRHLVEARVPPRDEPRLQTPPAARVRMRELGRDIRDRLVQTGVPILGDVSALVSEDPIPAESSSAGPVLIDPQIAALLVEGLFRPAAADVARARAGRKRAASRAQRHKARAAARTQGAAGTGRRWLRRLRITG